MMCRHVDEMIQASLLRTIKSVLDGARKHLVAALVINDDIADFLDDDNEQIERQQGHHLQYVVMVAEIKVGFNRYLSECEENAPF